MGRLFKMVTETNVKKRWPVVEYKSVSSRRF